MSKMGTIYFLLAEGFNRERGGAMKIGFTRGNPAIRIAALQTGCPDDLELLGYLPGNIEHERDLHRQCASSRIRGEWYEIDGPAYHAMIVAADHLHNNPI